MRAQHDALEGIGLLLQHVQNRLDLRLRGFRDRIAVRTRGQTRERDRADLLFDTQHQGLAVAAR